jgi:hypothetical protein
VRNQDDGGTSHQPPRAGQDNWLHARVRNKASAGHASHFVVSFRCRGLAGSQFTYPEDFFPCTAVKAEFDLAPGETRVVKARWPRAQVPPPGVETSVLASLISRSDHPVAGRHVWEHNNLAQKNLTTVQLLAGSSLVLPVVLDNTLSRGEPDFDLELLMPDRAPFELSLIHRSREFFAAEGLPLVELAPAVSPSAAPPASLECGGCAGRMRTELGASAPPGATPAASRRFAEGWKLSFPKGAPAHVPIRILPFSQTCVGLELVAPAGAHPSNPIKIHLVQRNRNSRKIIGGVSVSASIKAR